MKRSCGRRSRRSGKTASTRSAPTCASGFAGRLTPRTVGCLTSLSLSFGLADRDREDEDPASVPEPVPIIDVGKLKLRGSIDLVERHVTGKLRATDHKTGKARAKDGVVIGGGQHLQPVLYALACEKLLDGPVESGRLYYCTADGNYEERVVMLDDFARGYAGIMVETVGSALAEGFLPAAPAHDACVWCDYLAVCGPHEERRVKVKPQDRLDRVEELA